MNIYDKELDLVKDKIQINAIVEKIVKKELDSEFSSIWYYDKEKFTLRRERDSSYLQELDLDKKQGIIYKCFMEKHSKLYNYLASDKDYVPSLDNPDNIKIKSKVMLPLMDGSCLVGIVTAYNSIRHNKKFTNSDVEILKRLSSFIVNALYKMQEPQHEVNILTKNEISNHQNSKTVDETMTFVANFVHDIRTPANSLYGFLDLLEGQIKDERLKSYIINAKESASFINELTTSVLNMVSTHKESIVSEIEEVDSIKFFSSIAKSFASNMYAKKICFNIYVDPMLPKSIKMDTLKMKRIILNLIGNAYKFTPNNKTVEFSVRYIAKTNRIVMYVKDTGIGIPKEKQKTIFEAFKQAEDTTALNFGGTGLGLFISAKYVKELGGTLALISEVDKGSIFSFDIPAEVIDSISAYIPIQIKNFKLFFVMDISNTYSLNNITKYMIRMGIDKEQIYTSSYLEEISKDVTHIIVFQNKIQIDKIDSLIQRGVKVLIVEEELLSINNKEIYGDCAVISQYGFIANKLYKFISIQKEPRVLIVDDDKVSVFLIETILENEFCTSTMARDGKEAWDMFLEAAKNNKPFQTIYIDNNMPRMNGDETIRHIREYEKKHKMKAIYAVSTSGDQLHKKVEKEMYDVYLGKPFRKEQIKKALYQTY